ncbi:MAG: DoxX family protein [Alcanivoracaceae bacterium]|nr:DoxX family protein [Alcanivoracaceae bacterium]
MNNPDIGKLILRVALALMMLLHGVAKLQHGVGFISGMLQAHHLPGFFAYGVLIGEIVAPLMVLVGYQTRIGALLMVGNMLVAIALAHSGQIFSLGQHGGWAIELQAFYLFTALSLVFLGAGKYAVKN